MAGSCWSLGGGGFDQYGSRSARGINNAGPRPVISSIRERRVRRPDGRRITNLINWRILERNKKEVCLMEPGPKGAAMVEEEKECKEGE